MQVYSRVKKTPRGNVRLIKFSLEKGPWNSLCHQATTSFDWALSDGISIDPFMTLTLWPSHDPHMDILFHKNILFSWRWAVYNSWKARKRLTTPKLMNNHLYLYGRSMEVGCKISHWLPLLEDVLIRMTSLEDHGKGNESLELAAQLFTLKFLVTWSRVVVQWGYLVLEHLGSYSSVCCFLFFFYVVEWQVFFQDQITCGISRDLWLALMTYHRLILLICCIQRTPWGLFYVFGVFFFFTRLWYNPFISKGKCQVGFCFAHQFLKKKILRSCGNPSVVFGIQYCVLASRSYICWQKWSWSKPKKEKDYFLRLHGCEVRKKFKRNDFPVCRYCIIILIV